MAPMNTQEYFNKIVRHLLTQQEQALDAETGSCRYRTEKDGKTLRCAIGCVIPDELYDKGMENKVVDVLPSYSPNLAKHLAPGWILTTGLFSPGASFSLNGRLQKIHDSCPPAGWERHLRDLAREFGLTFPNLEVAP